MPAAFIYVLRTQQSADISRLEAGLLDTGLGVLPFSNVAALCSALERYGAAGGVQLVLLADSARRNVQAAKDVRRFAPTVAVIALQSTVDSESLLCALQSGIDVCWPADAPAQLMLAAVLRLTGHLCRLSRPASSAQSPWRLMSQGWVLETPDGRSVTLTSAERALIRALYEAPYQQLSHEALLRAMQDALQEERLSFHTNTAAYTRPAARRLSVLVSRLRHKFAAAGIHMPIRSVRRCGYQLSIALVEEAGPRVTNAPPPH